MYKVDVQPTTHLDHGPLLHLVHIGMLQLAHGIVDLAAHHLALNNTNRGARKLVLLVLGGMSLAHVDVLAGPGMEDVELVHKVVGEHLARVLDAPPDEAVHPDPDGPQLVRATGKTLNLDTVSRAGRPNVLQICPGL